MKNIVLISSFLAGILTYSQEKQHSFVQVREEFGDLNKDGLKDKVTVSMDNIDAEQPLKLEIFFLQPNKKFKLIVSSTEIMNPQYPNGKYGGDQVPDVFIEDGYFILYSEIKDVKNQYKFLFNNGKFELINLSKVRWDGKNTTTETEFNLLKGTRIEISQLLGSDKIIKKSEKKINIKPLPTIQTLRKFDNQLE
ncbi:hypothetical protein [Chryseobacterium sp. SIMBA_038]|uniref:hypothetical protein n=1 Tax=Chryseobacterium sp. SIMBA_038 TaxID=3085780 RepID=UPI00397934AF